MEQSEIDRLGATIARLAKLPLQEPAGAALVENVALVLRVLFPDEAWETYMRSAHCLIHEIKQFEAINP